MTKKFLFLYRNPLSAEAGPPPSPEEMQQALAAWHAWKEKFPSILDMGAVDARSVHPQHPRRRMANYAMDLKKRRIDEKEFGGATRPR